MLAIAAGLVILLMLLPPWLEVLPLRLKARRDYRMARGTLHLKQIDKGLAYIDKALSLFRSECETSERSLRALESELDHELRSTLGREIIRIHLPEAEGIGEKLTDLILAQCFDGTLGSLRRAHEVDGVGDQKQESIDRWLVQWEPGFPGLMAKDFPGKQEIMDRYDQPIVAAREKLASFEFIREYFTLLKTSATEERNGLGRMTRSLFIESSLSLGPPSPLMQRYLRGVHHEWEIPPVWFEDILCYLTRSIPADGYVRGNREWDRGENRGGDDGRDRGENREKDGGRNQERNRCGEGGRNQA